MRILISSSYYPPEVGSAAQLMAELAQGLATLGHDVTVLTSWPSYRLAEVPAAAEFSEQMMEGRVQVLRVKTLPIHNSGFLVRGIAQLVAPRQFWRALIRYEPAPFDCVIVYSPPLPLAQIGIWAKMRGSRFALNVQDLFPQNAIDLGVLTNPLAIALFRWVERRAYRFADVVTVHSPMNLKVLVNANPEIEKKVVVVHNWIDAGQFSNAPSEDFRQIFGLQGKFVAVYGGVVGPAQGLDVILEIADRVRDLTDVVFLVVGDGMEKARLEETARVRKLDNIVFRPFVSRERYPALLQSADIGFLTLSKKMKTPVVPGKILGYMAMALPVLAIVNQESDAHSIIADARCGYSCSADNIDAGVALIRRMYENRAALPGIGKRGQLYARTHFEKSVIIEKFEDLLRNT